MSAREEARLFLDQLRAQTHAALGTAPIRPDPAAVKGIMSRLVSEGFVPRPGQGAMDEQMRRSVEDAVARVSGTSSLDDTLSALLDEKLDHIEETAAARIEGLDPNPIRPIVGHLQSGQLNAVSMRVPGLSDAYLVIFEDQMGRFAAKLSDAIVSAVPSAPGGSSDKVTFRMPGDGEAIEVAPDVANRFVDSVVAYAVTGSLAHVADVPLPPGQFTFAAYLTAAIEYFVLGHEYAHVILGHLHTASARKGVLPAADAEALVYSWQQEVDADWLGMVLSINALVERLGLEWYFFGFAGISLFFDGLEVMDRAVGLLQTGDENARQLGSHPPNDLRKRRLRDFLPNLAAGEPAAEMIQTTLQLTGAQEQVIRRLWEHARPKLLDLRRRGVPAARAWRTVPKETGDDLPAAQS